MTQHGRMSTGRLLEPNQKRLCWETGRGLGKGDFCSAGVTEEKHTEETSHKLKCHYPGRARLLGKNLAKAAISKDGIFPASDCWILFLSFFLALARPTLSLPSFSHPRLAQEGGEGEQPPSASEAQGLWAQGLRLDMASWQTPDWPGPDLCDAAISSWKCHKVTPGTSAVSETKIWT